MECKQKKGDCMYNQGASCKILTNTYFMRKCPFYKRGKDPYSVERVIEGHDGVFRKVCGYGDKYYVSDLGEVMAAGGNFLKPRSGGYGNSMVELRWTYNGKPKSSMKNIDALVAEAFGLEGDGLIEHIDGDPFNNRLDNLRRKGLK